MAKLRTSLPVDNAFIADVRRRLKGVDRIVTFSIDPGANMGVSVDDGRRSMSVQGSLDDCVDAVVLSGVGHGSAHVFVREAPYTVSREQMQRESARATPQTIFQMGYRAGAATERTSVFIATGAPVWLPAPSTWRSILGLNAKATATEDARTTTNKNVHMWAEATAGRPMRTASGAPAFDEANAFAMGRAAHHLIRSILQAG